MPKNESNELVESWQQFGKAVLSPFVVWLLGLCLVLGVLAFADGTDSAKNTSELKAAITIIISIFTGVAGAIIYKKIQDFSEKSILVTRGESAIRGLNLVLLSVKSLENRLCSNSDKNGDPSIVDETTGRLILIQEQIVNSIQEWQDIIPSANIRSEIGKVLQFSTEKKDLESNLEALKQRLDSATENSQKEKEQLKAVISEKQRALSVLEIKLAEKENELSNVGVNLGSFRGNALANFFSASYRCANCGTPLIGASAGCPKCGSEETTLDQLGIRGAAKLARKASSL
jgi:rubrerythrin